MLTINSISFTLTHIIKHPNTNTKVNNMLNDLLLYKSIPFSLKSSYTHNLAGYMFVTVPNNKTIP